MALLHIILLRFQFLENYQNWVLLFLNALHNHLLNGLKDCGLAEHYLTSRFVLLFCLFHLPLSQFLFLLMPGLLLFLQFLLIFYFLEILLSLRRKQYLQYNRPGEHQCLLLLSREREWYRCKKECNELKFHLWRDLQGRQALLLALLSFLLFYLLFLIEEQTFLLLFWRILIHVHLFFLLLLFL